MSMYDDMTPSQNASDNPPLWALTCFLAVASDINEGGSFAKSSLTSFSHSLTILSHIGSDSPCYCITSLSITFNMLLFSLSPCICHQICHNVRSVLFLVQSVCNLLMPICKIVRR